MSSVPLLYRLAVRALRRSAPLLAFGESKVARGIRGRRGALEDLTRWARHERDPRRLTVWMHAPSVGEGLVGAAVTRALGVRVPGLQVAHTHFSPSAEGLGEAFGADVSTYLPWDVREAVGPALDAVEPRLLALARTEVWPVLVDEAARRGIPVALVGAVVREGAGRLSRPARAALRGTWERLSLVCACSAEDAERLVALGVGRGRVHVTGDPGIDSAARRVAEADPTAPDLAPFHGSGRPVVVAGSTWPPDEAVLLPAWQSMRAVEPGALLVLVPHEPAPRRVRALLDQVRGLGLRATTVGSVERRGSVEGLDVVIVDRVGILTHLYSVATVAFVGGGFGRDGLHSVVEPAAAGVPTLFGPRHELARAAGALLEVGAARAVRDPVTLKRDVMAWLADPTAKMWAAERAKGYIGAHLGAAERTAEFLEPLMRNNTRVGNERRGST